MPSQQLDANGRPQACRKQRRHRSCRQRWEMPCTRSGQQALQQAHCNHAQQHRKQRKAVQLAQTPHQQQAQLVLMCIAQPRRLNSHDRQR